MLINDGYHYSVDLCVIILCLANMILLLSTYTPNRKSLRMVYISNALTGISALSTILLYTIIQSGKYGFWSVYLVETIRMESLAGVFVYFCHYLYFLTDIQGKKKSTLHFLSTVLFSMFSFFQIIGPVLKIGIWFDAEGNIYQSIRFSPYQFYYVGSVVLLLYVLISEKNRLITATRKCIFEVMFLAVCLVAYQNLIKSVTFTNISFIIPIMIILSMFHYNPFDPKTGTLNRDVFNTYISDMKDKEVGIFFMRLKEANYHHIQELNEPLLHFNEQHFRACRTFRISKHDFVMTFPMRKNSNVEMRIQKLNEEFYKLYETYQIDFKITYVESSIFKGNGHQYVSFMSMMADQHPWNEFHMCTREDVKKFQRMLYVDEQLKDIQIQGDLLDNRIKVFCQPVYSTQTKRFLTAEALMRVETESGMIFPDEFIPVAEERGYIHSMTKVILNKTCLAIKAIEEQGYYIERVSVNVSMEELHDSDFCKDVISIIKSNNISFDKIAIELTESRNEQDYNLVKQIMLRLRQEGIKFYLDDFGTGYSSFERILGLPFDIIKFDRSLTNYSKEGEKGRFLVGSFSSIFRKSEYNVLFEGVEDEQDEKNCIEMNAQYLQGYKYSKPIPIEQLVNFLEKD